MLQACTVITQVFGIISILHGLGNHVEVLMETGELHNFLLFTWITVFWFNMAIPLGKVAVAAFLIEMNAQSSMPSPIASCLKDHLTSQPSQTSGSDAACSPSRP
jgi:hypothetical protein